VGEAFGLPAAGEGREQIQEAGCGAGEVAALLEEGTDGLDYGFGGGWSEGLAHFILGAAKGGAGGHGPGEGVGASSRARVDEAHAGEGSGDGGTERGKDGGPSLMDDGEEAGFGAGGEGRKGDGEGAAGEVGGTGPTLGDGE